MILVTGGAGYIGSHTCVELLQAGYEIVVFDNFSNSSAVPLQRIETITGKKAPFVEGDVRSLENLSAAFEAFPIEAVIHFAGLKAVGESVKEPLRYFDNNIAGALCLLQTMEKFNCRSIVFSSSATVYGNPHTTPIREDFPLSATNPYGRSKLIIEDILGDLSASDPSWRIARLRYFNPVGAHPSGLIGEDPLGIPNNLMPYIAQVAVGKRERLNVFGNDYDTPDGTGVRDYIHVVDLARGHLSALETLKKNGGLLTVNLGTGRGYSVLDMVRAFEKASGRRIPFTIAARRPGDVAQCFADPSLAKSLLGWEATCDLERMCADTWRWQSMNPDGYGNQPSFA